MVIEGMTKRVWDGCVGNGQDGGAAPALCVGPMVLPLILWFVSHQGEMNKCLDGFVPRHDAKQE